MKCSLAEKKEKPMLGWQDVEGDPFILVGSLP